MNQLQLFVARILRLVPVSLWWVLALLAGAVLSLNLEKELFPHTPAARVVAQWLLIGSLVILPVVGVQWLWRVAGSIEHAGWRLLWQIVAGGTSVVAGIASLFLLVLLLWLKG